MGATIDEEHDFVPFMFDSSACAIADYTMEKATREMQYDISLRRFAHRNMTVNRISRQPASS